jgi:hypothetical protein
VPGGGGGGGPAGFRLAGSNLVGGVPGRLVGDCFVDPVARRTVILFFSPAPSLIGAAL